jgi:hypothetical protein
MKRLKVDQRARVEKLAIDEGTTCEGCGRARLRCGEEALRTHDHGLMVYVWCANDVHPRGAYQYFTIPWGEHRHLEASLMHPSAWKECSRKLVCFAPLIGSSCWRC